MIESKFNELVDIVRKLRVECPWIKSKQMIRLKPQQLKKRMKLSSQSIIKIMMNLKKNWVICSHVIFHSVIAEEENNFNLEEVIDAIKEKLIRRHPHVFGDVVVEMPIM